MGPSFQRVNSRPGMTKLTITHNFSLDTTKDSSPTTTIFNIKNRDPFLSR